MRIITISRQFGSGGRELGKRLADALGWDYYDRELIEEIARESGLNDGYVDRVLECRPRQTLQSMTIGRTLSGLPRQDRGAALLGQEKLVLERIAARGRDCVIVGRNADVHLAAARPFSVFVCADPEARRARCRERSEDVSGLGDRELDRRIRGIDKNRASVRALVGGNAWGESGSYRLTVNTGGWDLGRLASALAELALRWFEGSGT